MIADNVRQECSRSRKAEEDTMNERYQICLRFCEEAKGIGMKFISEIRPEYKKAFSLPVPDMKKHFQKVLDERRAVCRTSAH
jgi:hypothetical protein